MNGGRNGRRLAPAVQCPRKSQYMTTDATQYSAAVPAEAATAANAPPPQSSDAGAADYQPLDPRTLRLWQLSDAIGWGVVLFIGLVVAVGVYLGAPAALPWMAGGWLLLALLGAWTIFSYHPRNYRAWGYRLDDRVLLIKRGVWFRSVKLLPLPRLQHVDIKRGPLQRKFGLATLTLHTAGTHAASIELPGLDADEAVRLRDRLVAAGGDDGV